MKVIIYSLDNKEYEGYSAEVILPGEDGELSILDFHAPCLYRLRPGNIQVKKNNSKQERSALFFIKEGVAKVLRNELVIFIEK